MRGHWKELWRSLFKNKGFIIPAPENASGRQLWVPFGHCLSWWKLLYWGHSFFLVQNIAKVQNLGIPSTRSSSEGAFHHSSFSKVDWSFHWSWLLPFLNPVFFPFLSQVLTPEFLTILLYTYLYIRVCVLANSTCDNSALYFKKEDEIKTILRRTNCTTKIHTIKEILRNAFRKKNVLRWKNEHLRMTDDCKYCK